MAPGLRRSDKRITSPARLSRMKREYEEAWPTFRSRQIWARVTPEIGAAELDAGGVAPLCNSDEPVRSGGAIAERGSGVEKGQPTADQRHAV